MLTDTVEYRPVMAFKARMTAQAREPTTKSAMVPLTNSPPPLVMTRAQTMIAMKLGGHKNALNAKKCRSFPMGTSKMGSWMAQNMKKHRRLRLVLSALSGRWLGMLANRGEREMSKTSVKELGGHDKDMSAAVNHGALGWRGLPSVVCENAQPHQRRKASTNNGGDRSPHSPGSSIRDGKGH